MHRIDAAGYAADNLFTDGNPSTGTPATVVDAAWLNDIQESLAQLIEAAGISLSKGDYTQLLKAIVTKGMQGSYFNIGTASGTADAITSSYSPVITALTNGMTLYVRATSTNVSASPTFTPNSSAIPAKPITKGAGASLAPGDIAGSGHWIVLQYDATLDKWVLHNPATGVVSGPSGLQANQNNTFTKAQRGAYSVLTDGAVITPDFNANNMFRIQLGGNRTLANPTNLVAGQSGCIDIYQDSAGSRTLAYQWGWQFPGASVPVLSTAIRAKDKLLYSVDLCAQATIAISIATPGVVTWANHGLTAGQQIQLTTTGALPTGLLTNTTYFVVPLDANAFQLASTQVGAAIATSGTQSGIHTCTAISVTANLLKGVA